MVGFYDREYRISMVLLFGWQEGKDRMKIERKKHEETEQEKQRLIMVSSLSPVMTDMCELLDSAFLDRESVAGVVVVRWDTGSQHSPPTASDQLQHIVGRTRRPDIRHDSLEEEVKFPPWAQSIPRPRRSCKVQSPTKGMFPD